MSAVAIATPLLAAACFGALGPVVARRLPPDQATWLLTLGGVAAALSGLAVLAMLASVPLGQLPGLADEGHWSVAALREHAPVDGVLGLAALLVLLTASAATFAVAARRGAAVLAAYRSCRSLPAAGGDLVVIADASAGAMAVPGRPGRIVVAQSLLAALSSTERRALLAHERAHLEHGHHWHVTAVTLAATANPLLRPLRAASAHAIERWADEEAAAEVGDRRQVASAVARAALMTRSRPRTALPRLAAATLAVPQRVAALLREAQEPRPALLLLAAGVLLVGAVAAVIVGKDTEHLFESAGRAYRATQGY